MKFVSANYNGIECAGFYCNEDISVLEQISITYEIFDIIRQKSYEIYGFDTDEAISVKITTSGYNSLEIDNMDLELRVFANCEIQENEINEIITENFKIIKESEQ